MADLICRKTMTRCLTPGMCRPHGGCRPTATAPTIAASTDKEKLSAAAQWARTLVWPQEVADARLGKTATEFMRQATPDVVCSLLAEIVVGESNRNVMHQRLKSAIADQDKLRAVIERLKAENIALRADGQEVRHD